MDKNNLAALGGILAGLMVGVVAIGRSIERLLPDKRATEYQQTALDLLRKQLTMQKETVALLREIHSDRKADLVRQDGLHRTLERMAAELTDHIRDEGPVLAALAVRGTRKQGGG